MAKRIEYQEMVDLDGYRKAVGEARTDYKTFADDVVKLTDQMQRSFLSARNELEQIKKLNASSSDGKQQEQYAIRAAELSTQLRNQKSAIDALNKTETLQGQVTETLISRQQRLITEYANLEGSTAKVVQTKKRLAREMADLQGQLEKLDRPLKAVVASTKDVSGQYNTLQKELTDTRRELRQLDGAFDTTTGKINRHNAVAVQLAQRITSADTAIKKMDAGMGQYGRNVGNYGSALSGLVSGGFAGMLASLGLVGIALAKVAELGGQAVEKMTQFEQIRGGLKGVTSDTRDLAKSQEFLELTADRLGISYAVLAESYKGVKVGTKDTALEGREADRIFSAFTNRLAEVKAPADKAQRALEALSQMISKGNVQAEELRGQLGDAMPGAFKLFADAAGVSTQELNNMLKNGEVLAVDILPKVADQLEKTFSGTALENVNSLTGATARLDNQTGLLLDTFNQTFGITEFFAKIKNGIADTLSSMRLAVRDGDWLAFFKAQSPGVAISRALGFSKDSKLEAEASLNAFKQLSSGMRKARIDILKDQAENAKIEANVLANNPTEKAAAMNRYKKAADELRIFQRANLKLLADDMKGAQVAQRTSDKAYHEKRVADVVKQAKELSLAERNALISRYQNQISSDQAKVRANPNLATSLNRDVAYAKEFIKAIQGVNAELDKKDRKDAVRDAKASTRAGIAAAAKAKATAEAALQNSLGNVSASTGTQLGDLTSKKEQGLIDEQQFIIARYNITVSGIQKRQALLKDAGKTETDEYARLYKELAKADADYQKGRTDLQEKAFKKALSATKDALASDENAVKGALQSRFDELESAYEQAQAQIQIAVAKRQISDGEGEKRLFNLKIQYLEDIQVATEAAYDTSRFGIDNRIAQLRAEGKTEVQIAETLKLEKQALDRAEQDRKDADSKRNRDRVKADADEEIRQAERAAETKRQIDQAKWEIASTAIAGFFEIQNNFRDAELAGLERQKEHELSLVGDNEGAKANIEENYARKSRELKRKQAIADKAAALFQIVLSTAQGAISAASKVVTLPLVPFIIALGAIQAAVVAARPIPEFYKGTSDAPEGPAWVGERGYELIESKKGGKSFYRMAAEKQVMYLNKHDRVLTHEETKRTLRVNTELSNEVRSAPGGSLYAAPVIVNNGLSKADLLDAFASQTIEQTILTEDALKRYTQKNNQRTEWKNEYFSLPKKR